MNFPESPPTSSSPFSSSPDRRLAGRGLVKYYGERGRPGRCGRRRPRRRSARRHGPERQRQDHPPARPRRHPQPDQGEVWLGGDRVDQLNDAARTVLRRRRLGFVFQDNQLLAELPADENVALPLMVDGSDPARGDRTGARDARPGRPGQRGRPSPRRTVRRPGPARRHRAGAGRRTAGRLRRRADRRAGRHDRRTGDRPARRCRHPPRRGSSRRHPRRRRRRPLPPRRTDRRRPGERRLEPAMNPMTDLGLRFVRRPGPGGRAANLAALGATAMVATAGHLPDRRLARPDPPVRPDRLAERGRRRSRRRRSACVNVVDDMVDGHRLRYSTSPSTTAPNELAPPPGLDHAPKPGEVFVSPEVAKRWSDDLAKQYGVEKPTGVITDKGLSSPDELVIIRGVTERIRLPDQTPEVPRAPGTEGLRRPDARSC